MQSALPSVSRPSPGVPHLLSLSSDMDVRLRWAGLAYLVVIVAGATSELMFRPMALAATEPSAQALALRVGLILDTLMLMGDVVLALLLYAVFRQVNQAIAQGAMVFRLVQAAAIAAALMLQLIALHMPDRIAPLLAAHADGYDLGLLFFAVSTALMANLVCHSHLAPKGLPVMLMSAAAVYLVGSLSALLAPEFAKTMEAAYVIPLLAEIWFCFWLLFGHRPR